MKKIYITIIIMLILIILCLCYFYKNKSYLKYTTVNVNLDKENKISSIDDEHKNIVKIYFPITNYPKLDQKIEKEIEKYVKEFKDGIANYSIQRDIYYSLYINYDRYDYKNYISIVLNIETFLGGAHPDHIIKTIGFDKDKNKIITIDDLIKENKNILNELSDISREKLRENEKFSNSQFNIDIFNDGTKPIHNNYTNFAFTDKGLKLYFSYYQIAPYYYGSTSIIIPYKDLKLKE